MSLRAVATGAALVLVGCCLAACGSGSPEPVRVMLVGDSVTQGKTGDWTWRYRLWETLVDEGVTGDFVGPSAALAGPPPAPNNEEYADPDFDRDHAARWGKRFTDPDWPVGELVEAFEPDAVVELLGVNDLLAGQTPEQVAAEAEAFVRAAQSADPDVDVVLGELSQSWVTGVAAYNALLPQLADRLSTGSSRVVAADAPEPYQVDVDTWDGLHPSATGEVKIAAAVADALAELGIGEGTDGWSPGPPSLPVS